MTTYPMTKEQHEQRMTTLANIRQERREWKESQKYCVGSLRNHMPAHLKVTDMEREEDLIELVTKMKKPMGIIRHAGATEIIFR